MIFEGFSTENKKLVQTVTTSADTLDKDIFETHAERLASRGGHFTENELIPVYFAALLGIPADDDQKANFRNMLFKLRNDLMSCPKFLIYMEHEVKPPLEEELAEFNGIDPSDGEATLKSLCEMINIEGDEVRTRLARETLPMFAKSADGTVMLNTAETLIVWLNRCVNSEAYRNNRAEIPLLMYYGNILPMTVLFLHFMSRIGFDVLYICSNLSMLQSLKKNNLEGRMQIFELARSGQVEPYPDKQVRAKLATVAYNASRELNNI
ncbi:MAG: YceG family protein, partial [Oscillospiraceae bacterium]|nr:YceG family protein [Oscillospiraceae bacterium]